MLCCGDELKPLSNASSAEEVGRVTFSVKEKKSIMLSSSLLESFLIPNLPQTLRGFIWTLACAKTAGSGIGRGAAYLVYNMLLKMVVRKITFHGSGAIRRSYFKVVISLPCDMAY